MIKPTQKQIENCDMQGLDGSYMKNKKGEVYLVENRIGDLYTLTPIDAKAVKSLNDFVSGGEGVQHQKQN